MASEWWHKKNKKQFLKNLQMDIKCR